MLEGSWSVPRTTWTFARGRFDRCTTPASQGVGSLCGRDTYCTAPLSCMTSVASSVKNQCSETCETADDCANVSGACLQAGLCVKICETGSDCPSGTVQRIQLVSARSARNTLCRNTNGV